MSKSGVFATLGSVLGMIDGGVKGTAEISTSYMDGWRKSRELAKAESEVDVMQGWTSLENKINKLHSEGKIKADSKENVMKFLNNDIQHK